MDTVRVMAIRVLVAAIVVLLLWLWAPRLPCAAGYCNVSPCLSASQCGPDCVCIRYGPGPGTCASIRHAGE
jgi:hypothetical protein